MFRLILAMVLTGLMSVGALGQSNSFTYQGQLKDDGLPANGSYNLVFKLFDGDDDQVGPTITRNGVVLTDGLFNQVLDFGAVFTGGPHWLQITANGVVLSPKQPLTATPLALYALNAPIGASPWQTIGNDIYNSNGNGGNVSIGGLSPTHRLTVASVDQETMRLLRSTTDYGEGARLNFGDEDYAFIEEDIDDALQIRANRITLGLQGNGGGALVLANNAGDNSIYLEGFNTAFNGNAAAMYLTGFNGGSIPTLTLRATTTVMEGGQVILPGGANPPNYGTVFNYSDDRRNYIRGATVIADTGGNVGIGTSTPFGASQLNVVTNATGYNAVRGDAPNGNGVVGTSAASGYGATTGTNSGNNGIGVYGQANTGTTAKGVWGTSNQGIGVYGLAANAQTADSAGVLGRNTANNGNGVIGEANVGSQAYGVWGRAGPGKGVYGSAGEFGTGVYGQGPPSGWAVYAQGAVGVSNGLYVSGTKNFRIDHPRDPENKYLDHFSAEGPEPLNLYRGTVILDAVGRATIELPDYFEDINKDFTYALTAVGGAMPDLHVASKVRSNRFQIAGGAPGGEVCWQVSGVRNDLYVRAYGAPVELEKPERERGMYTHPELYGKPPEMAIHYRPAIKQTSASDSVQE